MVFIYAAFSIDSMYEGVIIAPSAEKARDKVMEFYLDKEGSDEVDDMSFRVVPLEEDHRYDSDYPMFLEMIERECKDEK